MPKLTSDDLAAQENFSRELLSLGEQVRGLRFEQKMTLEELAERAGVSTGLLSQIERGIGNPSYVTLARIARALNVPLASLFQGPDGRAFVVKKGRRRKRLYRDRGVTIELLTPRWNRQLEMYWAKIPAGYSSESHPWMHKGVGEEMVFVVEGTIEISVGGEMFTLEAGDSITFPRTLPHWYRNSTRQTAIVIGAVAPPLWGLEEEGEEVV